jgi:hypothetical protein
VNIGVDLTPENTEDMIEFAKFDLNQFNHSDVEPNFNKLANRTAIIGDFGWEVTGDVSGEYRHLLVNGFSGDLKSCLIASGLTPIYLRQCGIEQKRMFKGENFDLSFFENGKLIGHALYSKDCETIVNTGFKGSLCEAPPTSNLK